MSLTITRQGNAQYINKKKKKILFKDYQTLQKLERTVFDLKVRFNIESIKILLNILPLINVII